MGHLVLPSPTIRLQGVLEGSAGDVWWVMAVVTGRFGWGHVGSIVGLVRMRLPWKIVWDIHGLVRAPISPGGRRRGRRFCEICSDVTNQCFPIPLLYISQFSALFLLLS